MSLSVGLCVLGYVICTGVALWLAGIESSLQRLRADSNLRPRFWQFGSALFATMAVGRSLHLGDILGAFGRESAREGGWYDGRRTWQEAAVLLIAGLGLA